MNERIRNLAEHCDFYVGNEHYNESHEEKQRLWVEKFAELIIQECASLFPLTFTDEQYQRRIDKTIRKHFGVDE